MKINSLRKDGEEPKLKMGSGYRTQEIDTIDVDTVSKMGISQDLSTVGDCKRGPSPAAG